MPQMGRRRPKLQKGRDLVAERLKEPHGRGLENKILVGRQPGRFFRIVQLENVNHAGRRIPNRQPVAHAEFEDLPEMHPVCQPEETPARRRQIRCPYLFVCFC
ncbi:MAG: hypothetical protein KGZ25_08045, partial [Planctomycetes bacterium]|nr:hypothetical protein [Planctomycetota bacterium]